MEAVLNDFFAMQPGWILFVSLLASIFFLSWGADMLVEQAVMLSAVFGIPKVIIGATLVSLGTTLPEASVSVFSALQGKPGLALGNAVGSVICDTGLVLGVAAIMGPLPFDRSISSRQGWLQYFSGILLLIIAIPWLSFGNVFIHGGSIAQTEGFFLVALLTVYLIGTVMFFSQKELEEDRDKDNLDVPTDLKRILNSLAGFVFGAAMVILSSRVLIPNVTEIAVRASVPEGVIGATLVAFGTSLPEFVTAVSAVRKGQGEIAVGNVIGADILNILFVLGASASVTAGGLTVPPVFFIFYIPGMLLLLTIFRSSTLRKKDYIGRGTGMLLLGIYLVLQAIGYFYF